MQAGENTKNHPTGNPKGDCRAPYRTGTGSLLRPSVFRYLVIPFLIYLAWVADTFLLEGNPALFVRYDPIALVVYTGVTTVLIGIIVPIVCLRPAFMSGAVNMFQVGFRSPRRTAIAVAVTALSGYLVLIMFTPFGADRAALFNTFALMLPTGIAGTMVCWVVFGTHLQAYVRRYGAVVSVTAGTAATGILYGLSYAATSFRPADAAGYLPFVLVGFSSAVFFFAVRDVWASSVFVTMLVSLAVRDRVNPLYTSQIHPVVMACAALSFLALAAGVLYLSKRFVTIRVPAGFGNERRNGKQE